MRILLDYEAAIPVAFFFEATVQRPKQGTRWDAARRVWGKIDTFPGLHVSTHLGNCLSRQRISKQAWFIRFIHESAHQGEALVWSNFQGC